VATVANWSFIFDFLATNPAAGRERQELNFSVRSHLHREHNIFYRVQEDHILIVRVLHQSMDAVRHLGRKL